MPVSVNLPNEEKALMQLELQNVQISVKLLDNVNQQ